MRTNKWNALNLLLSLGLIFLIYFSYFITPWGNILFIDNVRFSIFLPALLVYLLFRLLPLSLMLTSYLIVLILILSFTGTNIDLYLGYFLGIGLAIIYLNRTSLKFSIGAPLIVHGCGLLYLTHWCIVNDSIGDFSKYAFILSSESLKLELLLVIPLFILGQKIYKPAPIIKS